MFQAGKQAVGLGVGVLLYDLVSRGVHGIDWFRSIFVAVFAFLVLWLIKARRR